MLQVSPEHQPALMKISGDLGYDDVKKDREKEKTKAPNTDLSSQFPAWNKIQINCTVIQF
jgi:hypothetical protein